MVILRGEHARAENGKNAARHFQDNLGEAWGESSYTDPVTPEKHDYLQREACEMLKVATIPTAITWRMHRPSDTLAQSICSACFLFATRWRLQRPRAALGEANGKAHHAVTVRLCYIIGH